VTAVDDQAGDMPDLVPEQALFWVACYLTSRSYGGSAEGGWWFDEGELVTDPDIYVSVRCRHADGAVCLWCI